MSTPTHPRTRNRDQILKWASHQKKVPLSAAQATAMDSVYPDWRKTRNGAWYTKLEAVEAFVADKGYIPRAAAKDPAEKRLGIWAETQRYRAAMLSADRIKLLNERLPGWDRSAHDAWSERLEEVCCIVKKIGRVPDTFEAEAESRLAGIWLNKHTKLPESDAKSAILNSRIPGWDDDHSERRWNDNVEALVSFVAAHHRFPNQADKVQESRRLGAWLSNNRHASGRVSPQHRADLDRRVPGWDMSAEDKWGARLELAVTYFAQHGRLPSIHADDRAVAASGRWVGIQRRAGDSLPSRRQVALDAKLPAWRDRRDDKWDAMLEYAVTFESANGHLPSKVKDDKEQRRAAQWLQSQKMGTGMTPAREQQLDARIPRWREASRDTASDATACP